jgi:hypothetical protein
MKDLMFFWLLGNTDIGNIILRLLLFIFVIMMFEWWIVPMITAYIGVLSLLHYDEERQEIRNMKIVNALKKLKKDKRRKKVEVEEEELKASIAPLIWGLSLVAFALLFSLFIVFYLNK